MTNTNRKLLLLFIAAFVTVSFSSCLVRYSRDRKWHKKRNSAYHYKQHGGRRLWVRNTYKNTR